jgi:hypothetical protein
MKRSIIVAVSKRPLETPHQMAAQVRALAGALAKCRPGIRSWSTRDRAYRSVVCDTLETCERLLRAGRPDWPVGRTAPAWVASHELAMVAEGKDATLAIEAQFWTSFSGIGARFVVRAQEEPRSDIFLAAVRSLSPDWARSDVRPAREVSVERAHRPDVGVFTFVSSQGWTRPDLPLNVVEELPELGWVVTGGDAAQHEAIDRAIRDAKGTQSTLPEQREPEELPSTEEGDNATGELPEYVSPRRALPFEPRADVSPEFLAAMNASRREHNSDRSDGETAPLPDVPRPDPTIMVDTPILSVEQYASFCADVAHVPSEPARALARHGIKSLEQATRVHRFFAFRFEVDAPLRERWQSLVESYSAWLKKHPEPRP